MASNANMAVKQAEIDDIKARLESSELVVVAQYAGLTVKQITEFRTKLRQSGASFKVAKNTLTKRAIKGTKFESIANLLNGPTGIAASVDPVAAAKVAHAFAKDNEKLVIVGGALGTQALDAKGIEALAKLPGLNELRSKLLGLLQAPATKLAGILQAPARDLVGVTKAYGEKQ